MPREVPVSKAGLLTCIQQVMNFTLIPILNFVFKFSVLGYTLNNYNRDRGLQD